MQVAIIENTRATSHGQVGVALHEAGARVDVYKPWAGQPLPASVNADALVVFGGEQSALDDHSHPYLPALGAADGGLHRCGQSRSWASALARSCWHGPLAARTCCRPHPSSAGAMSRLTDSGRADPVLGTLPATFPIYQWHSDTFTLPPGAVQLATSAAAAQQGFRIGRATYATQFHFEANRAVVRDWLHSFSAEILCRQTCMARRIRSRCSDPWGGRRCPWPDPGTGLDRRRSRLQASAALVLAASWPLTHSLTSRHKTQGTKPDSHRQRAKPDPDKQHVGRQQRPGQSRQRKGECPP